MKRTLLAGVLGGVAMFIWASIAHMALPLGGTGISELPSEPAVLGAMQSAVGANSGMYLFPAMGPEGMAGYDKKLAVSPSGILIYHPAGKKAMEPSQLAIEFLTELLEAVLAVFLLVQTRIATFGGRLGFMTAVGVVASLGTNLSYWNWYGFPASYTAAYMAIQILEFVIAGLVAAALLRRADVRLQTAATAR
jgi:hypothetical protein